MAAFARLTSVVAPTTGFGAVIGSLAFLAGIVVVDGLVAPFALGEEIIVADFLADALLTVIIASPVVGFFMTMLLHMRRLQHELAMLAATDVLTGLLSRRAFLARTADAVREDRAGALLMLDADHFKRINDTWGHAVGDLCLQAIAEHLRRSVRPGDVVGRLGGEEFSIFLPNATREEAAALGERLCRAVAVATPPSATQAFNEALHVTLSAGAALGDRHTPLDRLLARADAALYQAKAEGRARLVVWSDRAEAEPADRAA